MAEPKKRPGRVGRYAAAAEKRRKKEEEKKEEERRKTEEDEALVAKGQGKSKGKEVDELFETSDAAAAGLTADGLDNSLSLIAGGKGKGKDKGNENLCLMAPMTPADDPDDNHDGNNDLDETQPGFWEHVLAADRDDRPWGVY